MRNHRRSNIIVTQQVIVTHSQPSIRFTAEVSDTFDKKTPIHMEIEDHIFLDYSIHKVPTFLFLLYLVVGLRLAKQEGQSVIDMTTFEYPLIWLFYEYEDDSVVVMDVKKGLTYNRRRLSYPLFYQTCLTFMKEVRTIYQSFDPTLGDHAAWGLMDSTEADLGMIEESLSWIEQHCKEPTYYMDIHKGNYKQLVSFD